MSAIVMLTTTAPNLSYAKDIYVSTSFHEPANEGLRFIYSYDGLRWDTIQAHSCARR